MALDSLLKAQSLCEFNIIHVPRSKLVQIFISTLHNKRCTTSQIYFGNELYMFRTDLMSIPTSLADRQHSLYDRHHLLWTVAYPGILFGRGVFNKFSWGQRTERERASGDGSPLVRGSGGSCNLVQEISFHIAKIFLIFGTLRLFMMTTNLFVIANVKQLRT